MIGKLLNINYNSLVFSEVKDNADFFNTKLPEIINIKALYGSIKLSLKIPEGKLVIFCAEGERVYKIVVLSNDIHKYPIGWFVYIPQQKRLDLYTLSSSEIPLIQWKNKKAVFKNYDLLLDMAGLDKVFTNIVNTI